MTEITATYQGTLRCEATHPSGAALLTDAPVDNHGKGESFSPTDLIATGLGTCMMTLMGIVAAKMRLDLRGATVTVHKDMAAHPLRRIAALTVSLTVPCPTTEDQRQKLIAAAMTCPVTQSLHPDIQVNVAWAWG